LVILVVGGLVFIHTHGSPVLPVAESHPAGAWMKAVLLLIFAYGGFEAALIPAGEVKNPTRDAPVALMSALVIVTTVYSWCR
jgi:amino acid transporter